MRGGGIPPAARGELEGKLEHLLPTTGGATHFHRAANGDSRGTRPAETWSTGPAVSATLALGISTLGGLQGLQVVSFMERMIGRGQQDDAMIRWFGPRGPSGVDVLPFESACLLGQREDDAVALGGVSMSQNRSSWYDLYWYDLYVYQWLTPIGTCCL